MWNAKKSRPLSLVALLLLACSAGGCGQEAVTFNNKLAAIEKSGLGGFTTLMGHFEHIDDVAKLDVNKMEVDYTAFLAAMDKAVTDVKAVTVVSADGAKEFHEAYLAYFGDVRSVITGEVRQGLDLMKATDMDAQERARQWKVLSKAIETKHKAAVARLQAVQKAYAAKNNQRLE